MKLLASPIIWVVLILSVIVFGFLYLNQTKGLVENSQPTRQIGAINSDIAQDPVQSDLDSDFLAMESDLEELSMESSDFDEAFSQVDEDNENVNPE